MSRARGEDGFLMIEVMFGSVVVVLITIAILAGLDGARDTTGQSKSRSVAATIAQDDQERLRSMRVADLSNRRETRTVTVAGVDYTVVSRADWVRDATGVLSCSNASTPGDYLRISSTASTPSGRVAPVVETSLVSAPPGSFGANYGTTAIRVTDAAGAPLVGANVALNSTPALSDVTNALGCAVFGNLLAGSYTASVTSGTAVGYDGQSPSHVTAAVTAGATTVREVVMDRAAAVEVLFDTKVAGTVEAARSATATLSNSRLPSSGVLPFADPAAADGMIRADSVFPFEDGYGVYAGTCEANNPTEYDTNYFTNNPGLVKPAPGGLAQVTVRMPAINVRVTDSSGALLNNARVFVTPADSGCSQTFPFRLTTAGVLTDHGYPFGRYNVCADNNVDRRRRRSSVTVNTNPDGTAAFTLALPSSTSSGLCP